MVLIFRLSERNCIEIINQLANFKLIDVIYTADGKEYVTPQHLSKEIRDELYLHDGRVYLVDLAKTLNVDYSRVKKCVTEIKKRDCQLVDDQLIDNSFLAKVATEANDILVKKGILNVSELIDAYNLKPDYLQVSCPSSKLFNASKSNVFLFCPFAEIARK